MRYRFADSSIFLKVRGALEDVLADLNTPQIAAMLAFVSVVAALMISFVSWCGRECHRSDHRCGGHCKSEKSKHRRLGRFRSGHRGLCRMPNRFSTG